MSYVLGVDGGGSKTHALLAEASAVLLGFGQSGTGNYEGVGLPAAMQAVAAASLQACQRGGVSAAEIEVGCFCLAGADFPEDFDMLQRAVQEKHLAQRVIIKNDSYAALRSGTRRPYGIVIIMGSGFNAAAIDPAGREHRLAGEGYLYGDWGGAGDIGPEVMHRIFRAHDGRGRPTMLTQWVLEFFGAANMEELTRRLYRGQIEHRTIAETTPLVFEAACAGDEVACDIVRKIGAETVAAAAAMMRRAAMEECEVDVVLGGAVFRGKGPLLREVISAGVHAVNPLAKIVVPEYLPVVGAVVAAAEAAVGRADDEMWENLESSYQAVVARVGKPDQS
jgi:N-acetylglucosamine kinase-like BadF-type ATPase